tara:strand:+ start:984 stop:1382 length:399 start_codon:yes stop_codon:yes gene_type:complete
VVVADSCSNPINCLYPLSNHSHCHRQPVFKRNGNPAISFCSFSKLRNDEDPIFWKILSNNAWFAIGTIPTSITLAIVMALFVNRAILFRSLVRMAFFTPTILPMIAIANIWLFFYTPDIGLIDQIARFFGFS